MNLDLKKKKSRVHPPNVPKVLLGHQYNPCNTMALGWLGIEILVSGKGCEEKHNRQMSIRLVEHKGSAASTLHYFEVLNNALGKRLW